jgi:hypothetical protein
MTEYYDSPTNLNPQLQADENKIVNKALTKSPVPYLSGLKLKADIKLGDLVLNTIDSDDVVWVCTDIEGWWTLPEPELPELIRGWGDGSYDARGRWSSRNITLKGTFLTQDASQVPAARAKLLEAANLVYKGGWLVVEEGPAKGSFVRLSGKPDIETVNARGRTEFSIGLKAADPIKYEYIDGSPDGYRSVTVTPVSGTATTTITNSGNTPVPIIIELSKGFSSLTPGIEPGATLVPVEYFQRSEDTITLQFASAHPFNDGDLVYLDQVHPSMNGYQTIRVADVHDSGDTLQIGSPGADIPITAGGANATISLSSGIAVPATITNTKNDQELSIIGSTAATNRLEIDTYNREVLDVRYTLNTETNEEDVTNVANGRAKVSTLIDWIYLEPGANVLTFASFPAGSNCTIYYRSGWIG